MAGLFAAQIETMLAHMFADIAIAHFGTGEGEIQPLEIFGKPHVRHDRGDHATALETAGAMKFARDERHDLIAIHFFTQLINHDNAVGIAIEGDANVRAGLSDGGFQQAGGCGSDSCIYVQPIGCVANDCYVGAQLAQCGRANLVSRAMRLPEPLLRRP